MTIPADPPTAPGGVSSAPWVALLYVPDEFAWADSLYRELHGAIAPTTIAGQPTRFGFPVPRRMTVYPDPRDPASLARYEKVQPRAKFLVVICSPHSSEAPWVETQIKAFKRAGGEERIIALVVESERDAQDLSAMGQSDKDWLPTWLRWRLDETGNFRAAAEPGEPTILDARPGRLSLDQAREQLRAILLDQPTPDRPAVVREATPEPVKSRRPLALAAGIAVALLPVGGYLLWPKGQPAAPIATHVAAAATISGPFALDVPAQASAEPKVSLHPTAAAPAIEEAPPAPAPEAVPPAQTTDEPVPEGRSVIRAPIGRTPEPETVDLDVPEPAPKQPTTGIIAPPETAAPVDVELQRWRRLRDLGDNLFAQRNREAGLLALTQATDAAMEYAQKPGANAEVQIEAARLCYRVGVLQRQLTSTAEARATLEAGRKILQRMKANGPAARERADLLDNIGTFLTGLRGE